MLLAHHTNPKNRDNSPQKPDAPGKTQPQAAIIPEIPI